MKTKGIHHISSIVGDAQRDYDFYTGVLGLRLVKQTLNYEDKHHYHLYYGNSDGSTGIVTTFPMNRIVKGRVGDGQVALSSYGLNPKSFEFWRQRLEYFDINYKEYRRFGLKRLAFQDPSGLYLEFIESNHQDDLVWTPEGIQAQDAFRGIERASLFSSQSQATLKLLTDVLGYSLVDEDDEYYLLHISDNVGGYLELAKESRGHGQIAVGAVHHLALKVDNGSMNFWKSRLEDSGYNPGQVKNRHYFESLYFDDKGGIIFELATEGPGLLIDESLDSLGDTFIIPKHFEDYKDEIFNNLKPLKLNK